MRPHRRQPTRLLCPWDSPGKKTRMGCHFLLQCMKVKVKVNSHSHVRLLAASWTAAYQAPPSMGFSRQEYWSGVPLPSPSKILVNQIRMKSTRRGSDSPVHRREKTPSFQIPLDKWPVSPGTPREASGVPCLNPRRGLTLLSQVCRDLAIGV